jgi:ammonium transporter, Amt family
MFVFADVSPYLDAPKWLNQGDTAWQLTAATFVGMQSIPGLAILYAGLVKKKFALNSAVMVFYAFAVVMLTWTLLGYNMSFGAPWKLGPGVFSAMIGLPGPALSSIYELGQSVVPLAASGLPDLRIPGSAMIYFQFVFAAISPSLIAGSLFGRMSFKAWMLFVPLWSLIVYSIGAFSMWGGGWLAQLGAVDYSGGYVIHLAAGVSGFVAAAVVGPRLLADQRDFEPNNLIMAFAGAGILWLGWNGFNGGDPYFANADAGAAVLNTNLATATALLVWLIADMWATGKPNAVSMINGMIAGLVAITPCAGFVNGYGAIAVGLVTIVPWLTLNYVARLPLLKKVDDTFSVLHTHGVAGLLGGLMAGIVSDPKMLEYVANPAAGKNAQAFAVTGWLYGNPMQFVHQAQAAAFIIALNAAGTFAILKGIGLLTPLRVTEDEMEAGDLAIHGTDPLPGVGPAPALSRRVGGELLGK